jgi:hypothetical protein
MPLWYFGSTSQGQISGSADDITLTGFQYGLGVSVGQAVYQSSTLNVLNQTDAGSINTCRLFGVASGGGNVIVSGVITNAVFTTAGGMPIVGSPVFLALASDDGNTSAGKFTATRPSGNGQIIQEIGICLDNSKYASQKICEILLQVKEPIQL